MNISEQKLDPSAIGCVGSVLAKDGWEILGTRSETTLEQAVFNFLNEWNTFNVGPFNWLTLIVAPHIVLVINQTNGLMHRFVDLDDVPTN